MKGEVLIGGQVLVEGRGSGPLLVLTAPISFWGGVDPASGRIIDVRHPEHGRSIGGMALALPGTIGSSSSASVMLELIASGHAPAALLLAEVDAILLLGSIVAREMGHTPPPALRLDEAGFASLSGQTHATVGVDGQLSF